MSRKLTDHDVSLILQLAAHKDREIRKLNETLSAKALGDKFGVHFRTIERVLKMNRESAK